MWTAPTLRAKKARSEGEDLCRGANYAVSRSDSDGDCSAPAGDFLFSHPPNPGYLVNVGSFLLADLGAKFTLSEHSRAGTCLAVAGLGKVPSGSW